MGRCQTSSVQTSSLVLMFGLIHAMSLSQQVLNTLGLELTCVYPDTVCKYVHCSRVQQSNDLVCATFGLFQRTFMEGINYKKQKKQYMENCSCLHLVTSLSRLILEGCLMLVQNQCLVNSWSFST